MADHVCGNIFQLWLGVKCYVNFIENNKKITKVLINSALHDANINKN